MPGEKTDLVIVLCPLLPQSVMKGGRVGNREEEDKVGAALYCGGCIRGRSLLFISTSNYNKLTIKMVQKKYTFIGAAANNCFLY